MRPAINFSWPVNIFIGGCSSVYGKYMTNKLGNTAVCSVVYECGIQRFGCVEE